jgi:hypothetical protein
MKEVGQKPPKALKPVTWIQPTVKLETQVLKTGVIHKSVTGKKERKTPINQSPLY